MASINNLSTLYANEIYKIFSTGATEISDEYATKTEVENTNSANTSNIATNTADIAVLNTKQLQNFQNISSITHLLNTDYQTNTTLTTNFYNKAEIDTTFTNYYTQTQIDTNLSTNFQTNTQLATNYYNKTEVDGLIAGAGGGDGYTDTEIDNLLDLRVPKSDFTNRFSANPIIDCSAPTVIHSGLTLNNSTVNISPVAGLTFSNQTGGGDKVLAEFKNATSYITLQGDKIFCNNTSDDAIKQLDLTNNNAGYKMSGKIETPTGGLVVENTADAQKALLLGVRQCLRIVVQHLQATLQLRKSAFNSRILSGFSCALPLSSACFVFWLMSNRVCRILPSPLCRKRTKPRSSLAVLIWSSCFITTRASWATWSCRLACV